jgi:hypothetical protein
VPQALKAAAEPLNVLPVLKQLAELQVALQKQVGAQHPRPWA